MLWFTVWTLLVAGTILGAVLLGRSLWRKVQGLGAAAADASAALEALADRVEELSAATTHAPARAQLREDTGVLRERLAQLRREASGRAAVRALRHQETYGRWRAYSR